VQTSVIERSYLDGKSRYGLLPLIRRIISLKKSTFLFTAVLSELKQASDQHPDFHFIHVINFIVQAWRLIGTCILMSSRRFHGPNPEEETPLLRDETPPRKKETPLPITQILVLLLLQISEPLMSFSIRPYINEVRSSVPMTGYL
jgi:hypothetical protein